MLPPALTTTAAALRIFFSMTTGPTVAVIGGGPGGMFICHALETYRRELMAKGDEKGLSVLPTITCFERAPGPGGVWRAERTFSGTHDEKKAPEQAEEKPTTNMYEALWTNGPKECVEFYDYTFQQHFRRPLPVYMPRQAMLEYIMGRVTQHCPDFLEKYMKCNTSVVSVRFVDSKNKFEVVTKDLVTDQVVVDDYDKCIWAAGENGHPKMPESTVQMFRDGGFVGRIVHSSDTSNFEHDVCGKRVLLIGGSYSAEDLALMAVKVGADKIYISCRTDDDVVSWTGAWPQNKVEVLYCQTPVAVTENGKCIQFAKVAVKFPDIYVPGTTTVTEIRDIDTIIFCTGYFPNVDMLDNELSQAIARNGSMEIPVPPDWRMNPNKLTDILGEVEAGDVRWIGSLVTFPGLYRGLSISNPAMMFLTQFTSNPLIEIDVNALQLLQFITGVMKIPSAEQMVKENVQDGLRQMQNPYLRYWMDRNYQEALDARKWGKTECALYYEYQSAHYDIHCRIVARSMHETNYPFSYGTYDELNDVAKTIREYNNMSYRHRSTLDPDNEEENSWRTFRDYTDGEEFSSVFTGDKAIPLKHRWLDMDANAAL